MTMKTMSVLLVGAAMTVAACGGGSRETSPGDGAGQPIDVKFHGRLRTDQQAAANAMLAHDDGILSATTAFGKTVIAAWLIAARKTNTLVLVHRRQLLDQWRGG